MPRARRVLRPEAALPGRIKKSHPKYPPTVIAATPPKVSAARLVRFDRRVAAESRSSVALSGLPPESRDKAGAARCALATLAGEGVSGRAGMICGATAIAERGLVSTTGGARGVGPPRVEEGGTSGGVPRARGMISVASASDVSEITLAESSGSALMSSSASSLAV